MDLKKLEKRFNNLAKRYQVGLVEKFYYELLDELFDVDIDFETEEFLSKVGDYLAYKTR